MQQESLFPESRIDSPNSPPPGFRYQEEALSIEEESELVQQIQTVNLKPFEFFGYQGNRRVASFGFRYNYASSGIEEAEVLPSFLAALLPRVASFSERKIEEFLQSSINEYSEGAGIGWHRDKQQFGIIVGISLLAPATMRLRRAQNSGWLRRSQILAPRSIYLLSGEARTQWEHSIPPLARLRYSLTFRTLAPGIRSQK